MNYTKNNTKSQSLQKRTKSFDSTEEVKKELAQTIYDLHQFSIDDIASTFGLTRQTLSYRNRQKKANNAQMIKGTISVKEVSE